MYFILKNMCEVIQLNQVLSFCSSDAKTEVQNL